MMTRMALLFVHRSKFPDEREVLVTKGVRTVIDVVGEMEDGMQEICVRLCDWGAPG